MCSRGRDRVVGASGYKVSRGGLVSTYIYYYTPVGSSTSWMQGRRNIQGASGAPPSDHVFSSSFLPQALEELKNDDLMIPSLFRHSTTSPLFICCWCEIFDCYH